MKKKRIAKNSLFKVDFLLFSHLVKNHWTNLYCSFWGLLHSLSPPFSGHSTIPKRWTRTAWNQRLCMIFEETPSTWYKSGICLGRIRLMFALVDTSWTTRSRANHSSPSLVLYDDQSLCVSDPFYSFILFCSTVTIPTVNSLRSTYARFQSESSFLSRAFVLMMSRIRLESSSLMTIVWVLPTSSRTSPHFLSIPLPSLITIMQEKNIRTSIIIYKNKISPSVKQVYLYRGVEDKL